MERGDERLVFRLVEVEQEAPHLRRFLLQRQPLDAAIVFRARPKRLRRPGSLRKGAFARCRKL